MPIPDYESLMPTVLDLAQQEQSIRGAVDTISDHLNLSPDERAQLIPSGSKTLIKSRIEWAVTYLVHAGLLKRPSRGHFLITERGKGVIAQPPDKIDQQFLKQFPEFVSFITRRKSDDIEVAGTHSSSQKHNSSRTPEERIGEAYEILEGELKSDLLNRIIDQSPSFFETMVVKLLTAMGYGSDDTLAEAIGKTGDGGIDGVIHQDKLGLDVVYVQAKRYAVDENVQRPELQSFVGALSGMSAQKGVFVTTSGFSSGALEYLTTIQQRVITIDGEKLVDLMVQHGVGVKVKDALVLHRIDEDFFIED